MKKRVILMGPPGGGKGTQAASLKEAMSIPHISTGDMLRAARKEGTELGKKADAYISAGQLVPDELVNGIVAERLSNEKNGFLLDGYPRTVAQADALDAAGQAVDAVVLIDVPDELIVSRIVGRVSCPGCGCVYHKVTMPPKEDGKCDKCGGALVQRNDDREEVVRERLLAYHKQTQPLVDYYAKRGLLYTVNGNASVDEVFDQIRKVLEF